MKRVSVSVVFVIAAVLGACGGGTPQEQTTPTPTPTPTPPPPAAEPDAGPPAAPEPPPEPEPPPDPNAVHARDSLGQQVVALIENATRVEVGHMQTNTARDAERQTLLTGNRIMGYRITGRLRALSDDDARTFTDRALDDASYTSTVARCANESWIGARFTNNSQKVELAIGLPCNQALWASSSEGHVSRWGANLTPEAAQALSAMIDAH